MSIESRMKIAAQREKRKEKLWPRGAKHNLGRSLRKTGSQRGDKRLGSDAPAEEDEWRVFPAL